MDTDKDGAISKEEAKGLMLQNFGTVDADKDGRADNSELKELDSL